jgi:hypothetical protein
VSTIQHARFCAVRPDFDPGKGNGVESWLRTTMRFIPATVVRLICLVAAVFVQGSCDEGNGLSSNPL